MLAYSGGAKLELANLPFARGDTGAIHRILPTPSLVGKLYPPRERTPQQREKLSAMLSTPPEETLFSRIAWPVGLLESEDGGFLGFTMPLIQNLRRLDGYCTPATRLDYPWRWYIHTAQNLCAAVHALHQSGHVIGNLSPHTIHVEEGSGAVTLFGADGYQIHSQTGDIHPCTAWDPAYLPPELLSREKAPPGEEIPPRFTQESDRFALAIHILSLLTGRNPPHFFLDDRGLPIFPPGSPSLSDLPEPLAALFLRAFSSHDGGRPRPEEWHWALEALEGELVNCRANGCHYYWKGAADCPWCRHNRPPPPVPIPARCEYAPPPPKFRFPWLRNP